MTSARIVVFSSVLTGAGMSCQRAWELLVGVDTDYVDASTADQPDAIKRSLVIVLFQSHTQHLATIFMPGGARGLGGGDIDDGDVFRLPLALRLRLLGLGYLCGLVGIRRRRPGAVCGSGQGDQQAEQQCSCPAEN